MEKGFVFGTRGIWHKPENDDGQAEDIEAVILEQTKQGPLYIFTMKPIKRGWENLTHRTATILPCDFSPFEKQ